MLEYICSQSNSVSIGNRTTKNSKSKGFKSKNMSVSKQTPAIMSDFQI